MNNWLSIDIDFDKQLLLDIFYDNRDLERTYHNVRDGKEQPISLMNPGDNHPYIIELQDKFNYVRNGYFLVSSGYHPHVDDRRQCVISFELKNDHGVPMVFFDQSDNVIDTVDMSLPFIWNTQARHGSFDSPSERIFYQIELEDTRPYDFYYKEHMNNQLLKNATNT